MWESELGRREEGTGGGEGGGGGGKGGGELGRAHV